MAGREITRKIIMIVMITELVNIIIVLLMIITIKTNAIIMIKTGLSEKVIPLLQGEIL